MHPAFFVGLFLVAVLAGVAQALILDQWDLRQLAGYITAYTLLLIIPPAIVGYLRDRGDKGE